MPLFFLLAAIFALFDLGVLCSDEDKLFAFPSKCGVAQGIMHCSCGAPLPEKCCASAHSSDNLESSVKEFQWRWDLPDHADTSLSLLLSVLRMGVFSDAALFNAVPNR